MKHYIIQSRMEQVRKLCTVIICLWCLNACTDTRMHNMVDDTVYLLKSGYVEETINSWEKSTYELYVIKSGVGQIAVDLKLVIDEQVLEKYNKEHGTTYKMLPKDLWSVNTTQMSLAKDAYRDKFSFDLKIQDIRTLQESSDDVYVIPCQLVSETSTFTFSDLSKSVAMLCPIIKSPYTSFALTTDSIGLSPLDGDVVDYHVELQSNFSHTDNLTVTVEPDNSLIADYNSEHGTAFVSLPQAILDQIGTQTVIIQANHASEKLRIQFPRKSFLKGTNYMYGLYLLPLRIKTVSEQGIDPKKSVFILKVSFNEVILKNNPLARWAKFNLAGVNLFAEGEEQTNPGSFFQFGRNVAFPASGDVTVETGVKSPADPKTWGNTILFPTNLSDRTKLNWYSDIKDDLNTWAKNVNAAQTAGAPNTYVGNNGGDPCPKGWHLPTRQEYGSLIYGNFQFEKGVNKTDVEEKDIDLFGTGKGQDYKSDYKEKDLTTVVAYRFKGTTNASAYRYRLVNYGAADAHIEIRAKIIVDSSIDVIAGWSDADWEQNDVVVRYFPITGYRLHLRDNNDLTTQKVDNQGKEFYMWIDYVTAANETAAPAMDMGFVGWNANSKTLQGGSMHRRAMAIPCRCIENK